MKPKYKYYVWEETPLTFYRILTHLLWIPLILGTIGAIQLIIDWISIPSYYTYGFFWYDIIARVCLWSLTAASIYFLQRGCWTGVVCFLLYLSLVTCNQVIVTVISSPDSLAAAILGGIIAWAILFLPCWIYFHKRRPIFYPFFPQDFEQANFTDPIHESEQESSSPFGSSPPSSGTQSAFHKKHPLGRKYDTYYRCPGCGNLVKKGSYTCDCGYTFRRRINWRKAIRLGAVLAAFILCLVSVGFISYVTGYQQADEKNAVEIQKLQDENKLLERTVNFWNSSVVLVTRTGTKYHHYGCPHLTQGYYYYRLVEAKDLGYTPCKDCCPVG